jgi:4-oxalocrotonate tautomerase
MFTLLQRRSIPSFSPENTAMPYIKIETTREGVTREQKQQLIKGVTDLVTQILNKDPHLTHVVIQEVELDDWGYAGDQVSVLREKGITAEKK